MPPNAHSAGRSVEGTLLGSVMSTTRRDSSCAQQSAEFPPISMERSIASFFFAPMRSIGFKGFQYMRIRTQRPGLKRPLGSDTQLFFSLSLSFSFNEHYRFFFLSIEHSLCDFDLVPDISIDSLGNYARPRVFSLFTRWAGLGPALFALPFPF